MYTDIKQFCDDFMHSNDMWSPHYILDECNDSIINIINGYIYPEYEEDGILLYWIANYYEFVLKNCNAAKDYHIKALTKYNYKSAINISKYYLESGDHMICEYYLKMACDNNVDSSYCELGLFYYGYMNDINKAIEVFKQGVDIGCRGSCYELCILYIRQNMTQEAILYATKSYELGQPMGKDMLSLFYLLDNQTNLAIECATEMINKYPDKPLASYWSMAHIYKYKYDNKEKYIEYIIKACDNNTTIALVEGAVIMSEIYNDFNGAKKYLIKVCNKGGVLKEIINTSIDIFPIIIYEALVESKLHYKEKLEYFNTYLKIDIIKNYIYLKKYYPNEITETCSICDNTSNVTAKFCKKCYTIKH